ncbi:N2,N2-dimethylguanosine tRNA methyltransferase-domain-containing protein [Catenaria anguillulae PL171]|uniref:tRNA (guanine(26)-N(2))-dimethyltransferase n=1 Tax=Catenaria anguillulae PL171 TaxID=765915 RepID=A0A1Y2HHA7_9FUNG|nr:N2,N2-dimethylguanosine tRNA methyltransferase-domain-containing protein [Catenaria anguillulae PL171]
MQPAISPRVLALHRCLLPKPFLSPTVAAIIFRRRHICSSPGTATFQDREYATITEGQATILFPTNNEVFYNPVQQFNRDMSIAAIRTWRDIVAEERWARQLKKNKSEQTVEEAKAAGEQVPVFRPKILEALAASGLRSVRYAKEIPDLDHILCNDLDPEAVESIKRNVEFNELSTDLLRPNLGDAKVVMYQHMEHAKQYHVVDLDPYGTASPFLDAAVQSVTDGGLMCITCTDMQVLAGSNFVESCFTKYGGMPLKADFCHEMALRLLLGAVMTTAARHKRLAEPILSCSIDFYIRVFVRIRDQPIEVKKTASKLSLVYQCQGCKDFSMQPMGKVSEDGKKFGIASHKVGSECAQCGKQFHIGGPAYNGPIHNKEFVKRMLGHVKASKDAYGTSTRMQGMLTVISEEIDAPLYRSLRELTTAVHCNSISLNDIGSALLNAGHQFSISHASPTSVKTDAPSSVVWDIIRAHARRTNAKEQPEGSVARAIMSKESGITVDFKYHKKCNPPSRKIKLVRFQENPTKHWGPKARAGGKKRSKADEDAAGAPAAANKKARSEAADATLSSPSPPRWSKAGGQRHG